LPIFHCFLHIIGPSIIGDIMIGGHKHPNVSQPHVNE